MANLFLTAKILALRVTAIMVMMAVSSVVNAQVQTVNYKLKDVYLADGSQMSGAFEWTYTIGDFEGGDGVFTALDIPWRPNGTLPPIEQEGMVLTIEDKQIEISLDGNFHDYGLDISLKFEQPLSPAQSSLIDLNASFFECCGNGFKDQPFISGSVTLQTVAVVNVDVDPSGSANQVHPHHDGSSAVLSLNDVISVVVLSSSTLVGDPSDFLATDIDPATVGFGPAGGGVAADSVPVMDQDFDNDGIPDAKFDFLTGDTGITCQDVEATITGETTGNGLFAGADSISADCDAQCH